MANPKPRCNKECTLKRQQKRTKKAAQLLLRGEKFL